MHDETPKTVGGRVRYARKLRKLRQDELAKPAGLTQGSLSDIESGTTKEMSAVTLMGLCKKLNVRPEWIVEGPPWPMERELSAEAAAVLRNYLEGSPAWRSMYDMLVNVPADRREEILGGFMKQLFSYAQGRVSAGRKKGKSHM